MEHYDSDWQQRYASKIKTVKTAIATIPRGRRIFIGSGAAVPSDLVSGLVEHGAHLADNEIVHILTLGPAPYVAPGMQHRFRHTAFFIGPNVRGAVHEGRADFMPVFLHELPRLITSRRMRIDVALIRVTPPDRHGYVSLGVSVDVVRAAVQTADLIIAEVNPNMPRTYGDTFLHLDEIDHLVPTDTPLPVLASEDGGEVFDEIGRNVASLIPDAATLQFGIGKIPDAVATHLANKTDLGVHTEMMSDGIMRLIESGVVTGRKKTLLPGKAVTSFVMGSQALYEWVHENPVVEVRPSSFTNDPFNIARNDNMISINSALAVDLTGQVAADTLMGRFFSGIGGQVDFIRGAIRSNGGKAILALPSTAKGGQVSRIQPAFEEGAGIVTSRGDVRFVVTEYGVADLWGKNIRQRALALIEIAHPDFRAELLSEAKERHYVFPDQVVPRAAYPFEEARNETLPDGNEVMVRPARLSDEESLQDLFYRLSNESTYKRFMSYKLTHPHEELQRLVDQDFESCMALVVTLADDPAEDIIAMARYDVDPATRLADVAFVVRDDWQNRRIGSLLLRRLADIARSRGLKGFTADVLADNHLMLGVFHESGLKLRSSLEEGVYHLQLLMQDGED